MAGRFYGTERWERKRRYILARDGYQCQVSKRYGRLLQADTVHHIFPLEIFPEYKLSDWNLISVNHSIHDQLHDRTTHRLTEKGKDLLRRTARKYGIDYDESGL